MTYLKLWLDVSQTSFHAHIFFNIIKISNQLQILCQKIFHNTDRVYFINFYLYGYKIKYIYYVMNNMVLEYLISVNIMKPVNKLSLQSIRF